MNHSPSKSYLIGFVFSIAFTCAAFLTVSNGLYAGNKLVTVILGLALLQTFVQLYFFLHIGQEKSPRFNLWMLLFTFLAITILIVGSIWIMAHLNYNMSPEEMLKNIKDNQGAF